MRVLDFLEQFKVYTREGKINGPASRSELKRWCEKGCVLINGAKVKHSDEIELPVNQLIFFPDNPRQRITMRDQSAIS